MRKSNKFAKVLRSRIFKQKVVESKKLYNRKKEKQWQNKDLAGMDMSKKE